MRKIHFLHCFLLAAFSVFLMSACVDESGTSLCTPCPAGSHLKEGATCDCVSDSTTGSVCPSGQSWDQFEGKCLDTSKPKTCPSDSFLSGGICVKYSDCINPGTGQNEYCPDKCTGKTCYSGWILNLSNCECTKEIALPTQSDFDNDGIIDQYDYCIEDYAETWDGCPVCLIGQDFINHACQNMVLSNDEFNIDTALLMQLKVSCGQDLSSESTQKCILRDYGKTLLGKMFMAQTLMDVGVSQDVIGKVTAKGVQANENCKAGLLNYCTGDLVEGDFICKLDPVSETFACVTKAEKCQEDKMCYKADFQFTPSSGDENVMIGISGQMTW